MRICAVCQWRELPGVRPLVCEPCENRMRGQLRMLGSAPLCLDAVASHEPTRAGGYDLTTAGLAWPAHLAPPVGPLADQLGLPPVATILGRWAEYWALCRSDGMPASFYVRKLIEHLGSLCAWSLTIVDFAGELGALYATVRRVLYLDLRQTRHAAPCPHCGEANMVQAFGADEVTCHRCGSAWTEDEFAVAALQTVPDDALLYASEVAILLGVKPNAVDQWCWRGRLAPDAWDGKRRSNHPDDRGRPLYSAGQARWVAHKVMLHREWKAQLILRRPDSTLESQTFKAHTVVEIEGVMRVRLQRGAVLVIGPIPNDHLVTLVDDDDHDLRRGLLTPIATP